MVGIVGPPGGGDRLKLEEQPHAKQIAHAPQLPMWSADQEREPVSVASDFGMHSGLSSGSAEQLGDVDRAPAVACGVMRDVHTER